MNGKVSKHLQRHRNIINFFLECIREVIEMELGRPSCAGCCAATSLLQPIVASLGESVLVKPLD